MTTILFGPAGVTLIGAVITASGVFWAAIDKIKSERESREKSEEIARLSQEALHAITGGDSYCYLRLVPSGNGGKRLHLTVIHQGKHTMYDVQARIVDLDRFHDLQSSLSMDSLAHTDTYINIGTLPAEQVIVRNEIAIASLPKRGFNVFFTARNGLVSENLRFAVVDGKLAQAIRVHGREGLLLEKIDSEFPRGGSGQIEWGE